MPETFPEAGSAWRRDGRPGSPEKGPGGSPLAALPRGRVGMARPLGGDLGKRSWSRHGAAGVCLGNKTEAENGGGDMGSHCENGLADEREMGGEVSVDEVAR